MVIRRYISRWFTFITSLLKSNNHLEIYSLVVKSNNHLEIYLLITTKEYISRWKLLFSGNKKVYFEVEITLITTKE